MKFSERLKSLGFTSYAEYLRSEHWHGFRARYRDAEHRMTCLVCSRRPIQLHHHTYVRLGAERFDDVTPLCRAHHVAVHDWLKSSGRVFVEYTHEAVAVLGGTWVAPKRMTPEQGKALGLRKRDERRAAKKLKRQQRKAERRAAPPIVPTRKPDRWPDDLYQMFMEWLPKMDAWKAGNIWASGDAAAARRAIARASGRVQKLSKSEKKRIRAERDAARAARHDEARAAAQKSLAEYRTANRHRTPVIPKVVAYRATKKLKLNRAAMAAHTKKMRELVARFLLLTAAGSWSSTIPRGYRPRTDDPNLEFYVTELERACRPRS